MITNVFNLDAGQFPDHNFNKSLLNRQDDTVGRDFVLYVKPGWGVIAAEQRNPSKIQAFRDAIRLPKRSVVEQREEVTKLLLAGISHCKADFDYKIDPAIQARLFGSSKYRNLTVNDLADLVSDVERNVRRQPEGYGKEAFSHEQWTRIVDATDRALVDHYESMLPASNLPESNLPNVELQGPPEAAPTGPFRAVRRLHRNCVNLFKQISSIAPHVVKKYGIPALGVALLGASVYVAPVFGATLVAGAAAGFVIRHFSAARMPKDSDERSQIQQLSGLLAKAWNAEFAKTPGESWASQRHTMLVSSGERFSSELRSELAGKGWDVDTKVLRDAIRGAFDEMSAEHAKIKYVPRASNEDEVKVTIGGDKYINKTTIFKDGPFALSSYSNAKNPNDKIIIRDIINKNLDNTEMRGFNNRVMDQAYTLEKLRGLRDANGHSLSNYLGMVKLESGYIGQVFKDDRDLLSLSTVHDALNQGQQSLSKEKQQRSANINTLLIKEVGALSSGLIEADVPVAAISAGDFIVNAAGYVKLSLGMPPVNVGGMKHPEDRIAGYLGLATTNPSGGSTSDSGRFSDSASETDSGTNSVASFTSAKSEDSTRKSLVALIGKIRKGETERQLSAESTSVVSTADSTVSTRFAAPKPKGFFASAGRKMGRFFDTANVKIPVQVDAPENGTYLRRATAAEILADGPELVTLMRV